MNPRSVKAKHYRTFEELDLRLPAGCCAILGENGAGKSSIVNIIDLCLFGADGRSWAPYLTQGVSSTELELELCFEHGGREYRVRRGYSARGNGKTTLDLEVFAEMTLTMEPITRETQAATQELLERILGLTRETFRASAFLTQGDGAAFTEAKPADRKRILGQVLGLDRFERLQAFVKRDRKAAETELAKLVGALERADADLAALPGVEDDVARYAAELASSEAALAAAELRLTAAAEAYSEAQKAELARAGAQSRVTDLAARRSTLERALRDAEDAEQELAVAQDEIAALTTSGQMDELRQEEAGLVQTIEAHRAEVARHDEQTRTRALRIAERDAVRARRASLIAKAEGIAAQRTRVDDGQLNACPTCAQPLGEDAREATSKSLLAQLVQLEDEIRALADKVAGIEIPEQTDPPTLDPGFEAALRAVRDQLRAGAEAELQRSRIEGRSQALRQQAAKKPNVGELEAVRAAHAGALVELERLPVLADEDALRAALVAAKSKTDQARLTVDHFRPADARARHELERLQKVEAETQDARAERDKLLARVDRLAVVERAYSRDGIPSLIIANAAIPAIEAEAARILAELGTSYRVEVRTEKALKGGGIGDALDVIVITDDGERPYETFSGGERTRLNLALRIALARLLAHRRGAESRLLAIDEPEFLDEAGTAALATVLQGLSGDFERVYLISHVPALRDSFDAALEVVKVDGRSEVRA